MGVILIASGHILGDVNACGLCASHRVRVKRRRKLVVTPAGAGKLFPAKFAKIKSRQDAHKRLSPFSGHFPNFDCWEEKGTFSTPTPDSVNCLVYTCLSAWDVIVSILSIQR
jgi:hypothetical protein